MHGPAVHRRAHPGDADRRRRGRGRKARRPEDGEPNVRVRRLGRGRPAAGAPAIGVVEERPAERDGARTRAGNRSKPSSGARFPSPSLAPSWTRDQAVAASGRRSACTWARRPGWARPTRCCPRAGGGRPRHLGRRRPGPRPTAVPTVKILEGLDLVPPRPVTYRGRSSTRWTRRRRRTPPGGRPGGRAGPHEHPRQPPRQAVGGRPRSPAAGIEVITTVNVQHIESLNDVVADIPASASARRCRTGWWTWRIRSSWSTCPPRPSAPDDARQRLSGPAEGGDRPPAVLHHREPDRPSRARPDAGGEPG